MEGGARERQRSCSVTTSYDKRERGKTREGKGKEQQQLGRPASSRSKGRKWGGEVLMTGMGEKNGNACRGS
jgi:hypothetical protein